MPFACENPFSVNKSGARRPTLAGTIPIIAAVIALIFFLWPGMSSAVRIAGEDEPVSSLPAKTAQKAPPAKAAAPIASPRPSTETQKPSDKPGMKSPEASGRFATSQPSSATPSTKRQSLSALSPDQHVTIDFDNVDIQVFIKFISEMTGRNFVIDDKVRGKVTLISPKKIAVSELYKVFQSVMETYGFATVESGDLIKVVPALDARGKNVGVNLRKYTAPPDDKIVTQILSLKHANPDEMKKVLDPLVSRTSIVLSYPPTGMLIITDVESNVKRLQDIVTALDVEGVGEVISYIPLKYASSTEMAKSLSVMFQQQTRKGGTLAPIRIVADDRTNALIILATENDTARIRELLELMDKEIPRGSGSVRVYYLQNAKAEDLVKVLTGLPQGKPANVRAAATPAAAAAAAASALSKNVQIMADKATNSLIITADTADYLILEDVIRKLDIPRPMVYLEGLIMEVKASKSFGVGVEWSMLKDANISQVSDLGGSSVGVAGFRGNSIIPQADSSGSVSLPSGFSLGIIGAGITIGGVLFPNIGAVLQAYQNDADVRILSTPQLLTLDNEDAEITVGQNVPYVTRQDTTVGSTTNYSNYEYKDVGVTLKVTPQINRDGFIRMKIDQSVTKILSQAAEVDSAGNKVLTPTTLKRTAKTTVVIKSGETVVIGGMIQDDSESGDYKVPLLGDIPLLGWLFKSRTTNNERTNLYVFLTPRIVEKPEDAVIIRKEKQQHMQMLQEGTVKNMPKQKKNAKEDE